MGATLLQEQDDGKLQPVAYISRRLETNELPYGFTETELQEVVWASHKLRPNLERDFPRALGPRMPAVDLQLRGIDETLAAALALASERAGV